jgi:hypothetical protein
MTQWRIQLSGDPRDLEALAAEPQSAEWSIRRDREQFMLTSISFDPVADSSTIWARADGLVARIDRAARLGMSSFGGVRTAALRRGCENDGSRIDISTRDSLVLSVKETAEIRIGLDAVVVAPTKVLLPACPNLPDLVALQQASSDFGEAISYLDDDNWHAYYKAFEALRAAIGSETRIQQLGWASKKQISRFKQSAQPDRHHGRQSPKNPMSLLEGRAFIRDLFGKWATWEVSKL